MATLFKTVVTLNPSGFTAVSTNLGEAEETEKSFKIGPRIIPKANMNKLSNNKATYRLNNIYYECTHTQEDTAKMVTEMKEKVLADYKVFRDDVTKMDASAENCVETTN